MKDQDIFENLLTLLKSLCNILASGAQEASSTEIAETFRESLDEALAVQHDVYKAMEDAGFYQTSQVPVEQINQVQDKFVNCNWQ
jgi:spore coat protein CotF